MGLVEHYNTCTHEPNGYLFWPLTHPWVIKLALMGKNRSGFGSRLPIAIPRAHGDASEHGEGGKEHGLAWSRLGQDSLLVLRL